LWQIVNVSQHADICLVHPVADKLPLVLTHISLWQFHNIQFFYQMTKKFCGGKEIVHLWPCPSIFLFRFYHSGVSGCQMLCPSPS